MTEQQLSPRYHIHESQQTAEEILAYWTPERLAEAQPLPFPSLLGEGRPANENRPRPAARPASPALEEPGTLVYKTSKVPAEALTTYPYQSVGKLFFFFDGEKQAGSAAVVAQNGLITAAHNLFDPKTRKWAEKIQFFPAFTDNYANENYGIWSARDCAVPEEWYRADPNRLLYDVGFIKLNLGGRSDWPIKKQIGNVVKPLPLLVDMKPTESTSWLSLGYPAVPIEGYPFDGENMWQCSGDFRYDWSGEIVKDGNFTKGASGGPWLFYRSGSYQVNGVESRNPGEEGLNLSSYFGTWVKTIFSDFFHL